MINRMITTCFLLLICVLPAVRAQGITIHVLNPWANDPERSDFPLYIRGADAAVNWHPGVAMTNEIGNWRIFTFEGSVPANQGSRFVILTAIQPYFSEAQWFDSLGLHINSEPLKDKWFDINQIKRDNPGVLDIYIYLENGNVIITEVPPDGKTVFILNPWTISAPAMSLNGDAFRPMRLTDNCEWFKRHIITDTAYSLSFQEIFGSALYGAKGLSDSSPINLNAHFAVYDSAYIYPDPMPGGSPAISPSYPGFEGSCGFNLAATVRDFSMTHPDFEGEISGVVKEMVEPILGPDRKPRIGPNPSGQSAFDQWFNTVPNVNAETCVDLPMSKTSDGLWEFDSYHTPYKGYWPIDDFAEIGADERFAGGNDPTGELHNFHFCLEMHANFVYKPGVDGREGQTFRFQGDDDVWVFIDNKLLIDLGGVHSAATGRLVLDEVAGAYGWNAGDTLPFDFFFCERHTVHSNLWIKSSIFFAQELVSWIDTVTVSPTVVRYDVRRRIGGDGSCGSLSSGGDTIPEKADYELTGPGITGVRDLNIKPVKGISITGLTSIAIDTVTIRTSNALAPGQYGLTIRTHNRPIRTFRIPFTVYGDLGVKFVAPKLPVDTLAGVAVPIIVQAVGGSAHIAAVRNYNLQIPPGLQVYLDPDKTNPAKAPLSTDATGFDTLWVTGAETAAATHTYTLGLLNESGLQTDTYPYLTFRIPEVAFTEKPSVDTLVGVAVPINIGTIYNNSVVIRTRSFSLAVPDGVNIYQDPGLSVPLASGTLLTTDAASGTKKLWAVGKPSIPDDILFTIKLNNGQGTEVDSRNMTFRIPRLRFVDAAGKPLNPLPSLTQKDMSGFAVRVEVYTEKWGICVTGICNEALGLTSSVDGLGFKAEPTGKSIASIAPVKGYAGFYLHAGGVLPSVSFIVQGASPGTRAEWKSGMTISYNVQRSWIIDGNKDGRADSVFIKLGEKVTVVPTSITSVSWPEEGNADKTATGANISKYADSVIVIDFYKDPYEQGKTSAVGRPELTMPDGKTSPIEDGVGPVLIAAEITPPTYKRYILLSDTTKVHIAPDTLVLRLSEPIAPLPGAAEAWRELLTMVKGCKEVDSARLVPIISPPLTGVPDNLTLRIPVIGSDDGQKVALKDCVYLNAHAQYSDAKYNPPSPARVKVTGDASDKVELRTSLLIPIIGQTGLSGELNMPKAGPIVLINDAGEAVGFKESGQSDQWIPPIYMNESGVIDGNAQNSCDPGAKRNVSPGPFPENCLSAVGVYSGGPYTAEVTIIDHLGKYIHSSVQKFGSCGELEDPRRSKPGGYASFLIWNQKDAGGKYVGSGVYLWSVRFNFGKRRTRYEIFKQGVVRGEQPKEGCALQ